MSDKYKNEKGVYIDVHTDRRGKDHIDFYDRDPKDPNHESIHIGWDSSSGKGSVRDTTGGGDSKTDTSCYLTSACMKHFMHKFDDNCEELTILRWFRDNFVSQDDIKHYYVTAPIIVEAINNVENNDTIYNYIYENIVSVCVNAIKKGDYDFAYNRYKNSVLTLEEQFARPALTNRLVRTLKPQTNN